MAQTAPAAPSGLLARIELTRNRALESGSLQPILTERATLENGALPFSVRWISSLEHKHAAREQAAGRRDGDFNPFLPPEPALTVGPLGEAHLAVLNKFPVIDRHLLVITRAFEDQTAPLTAADFAALAFVMGPHGGLGFYNGGAAAGASQRHKHLQWIPAAAGEASLAPQTARLTAQAGDTAVHTLAELPYRHAFVRLNTVEWDRPQAAGERLHAAFVRLCAALDVPAAADPMPPYNLLLDRDWMLLVPRRREHWEDISVNALGFAGSLFVRRPAQIELIRTAGPLRLLAEVAEPADY
ncbi:ATP adenylyltransferase family protein [Pseudothauera rhizosphaerae]|uniref:Phosphorylase n=1 Tax=Pseudothauera rhizosphaerae TaxID=2565932 RepID=A0A4S4AC72_9RHOO|nr:phosphorylase [Pseudothauera rhizosphaerae]THF56579.1 phosphorylase [Pseudothauera rhizosphaerae]